MQVFKVAKVTRQNGPLSTDRVSQMDLVTSSGYGDVGWDLDIVPLAAQQSDESGIDAIVVQVKPHGPSLARSSVESVRGLPLNR